MFLEPYILMVGSILLKGIVTITPSVLLALLIYDKMKK